MSTVATRIPQKAEFSLKFLENFAEKMENPWKFLSYVIILHLIISSIHPFIKMKMGRKTMG